jgi:hypothetical protein
MRLSNLLNNKNNFFIMHLSYNGKNREGLWNYSKKYNVIGLDNPGVVKNDWNLVKEEVSTKLSDVWVNQFNTFCYGMNMGDIVVVFCGWDEILGVGRILEDRYGYDRSLSESWIFFDHIRNVEWIRKFDFNDGILLSKPLRGFNRALIKLSKRSPWWKILYNIDI